MPLRLTIGLENTGKRGGGTPWGPVSRFCESAMASLSYTQRCPGCQNQASPSSVGMLAAVLTCAKYCSRHGSASQMGMAGQVSDIGRQVWNAHDRRLSDLCHPPSVLRSAWTA